jgi:hypothetical protein
MGKKQDKELEKKIKQLDILTTYDMLDDDDISTERLLAMVCDECHCEVDDVIDALVSDGRIKNGE